MSGLAGRNCICADEDSVLCCSSLRTGIPTAWAFGWAALSVLLWALARIFERVDLLAGAGNAVVTATVAPQGKALNVTRPAPTSLLPIDVEILRFAIRFTAIRPLHAVGWSGASPWTVRSSLRRLTDSGMLAPRPTVLDLLDRAGRIHTAPTVVYVATGRGASYAGAWPVAGYDDLVSLTAPRPSASSASHTDGVASLACWYRAYGYQVVAEREIASLERPTAIHPSRSIQTAWTVPVSTIGHALHTADLIAVAPDGKALAVELERAQKPVSVYTEVVGAYVRAGRPQVWHALSNATAQRLAQACRRVGLDVRPDTSGVNVSSDGLFRLQGWLPAPAAGGGPESWKVDRLVPKVAPAGLPGQRVDLSSSWRRGTVLTPDEAAVAASSVMIA